MTAVFPEGNAAGSAVRAEGMPVRVPLRVLHADLQAAAAADYTEERDPSGCVLAAASAGAEGTAPGRNRR